MKAKFGIRSRIKGVLRNKYGEIKQILRGHNALTTVGQNHYLDIVLRNQTQVATWRAGLIHNTGTPTLAAADTMSSHAGWSESADYDEANRPDLTFGAAAAGVIATSSTTDFTITVGNEDIYGIFITSDNTKDGTSGTLLATAAFDSVAETNAADVIELTYETEIIAL